MHCSDSSVVSGKSYKQEVQGSNPGSAPPSCGLWAVLDTGGVASLCIFSILCRTCKGEQNRCIFVSCLGSMSLATRKKKKKKKKKKKDRRKTEEQKKEEEDEEEDKACHIASLHLLIAT